MKIVILLFCVLSVSGVKAQTVRSDGILLQTLPTNDSHKERKKDLRYEGLYTQNVASELLELAFLRSGDIRYELEPKDKITITCPSLPSYKLVGVMGAGLQLDNHCYLLRQMDSFFMETENEQLSTRRITSGPNIS